MNKHTPKPWEVDTSGPGNCIDITAKGPINDWIARISLYGTPSERLANGYLMAAAPDLLEALEDADEEICTLCKRLNPQHSECTSCDERDERLIAIAKARGTS